MKKIILILLLINICLFSQTWEKVHLFNVKIWEVPEIPEPPLFKPTDIDSCVMWVDASDDTTVIRDINNNVSTWEYLSSHHRNFYATLSSKPLYNNIEKSIFFDGVDQHMDASGVGLFSNTVNTTIFIVSKSLDQIDVALISLNVIDELHRMTFATFHPAYTFFDFGDVQDDYGGIPENKSRVYVNNNLITSWYSYKLWSFGRNNANMFLRNNGLVLASHNHAMGVANSLNRTINLGWAGNYTGYYNARFHGYVREIIIYDRALTSNEINQVEIYLNNKWNLY